jgi:osmotically-inducible protein OsmY
MKTLIATLLATAAGAAFAAPTFALNNDATTLRNMNQKAAADYQAATAKCDAMKGNDKDVCVADAKVTRVRAENAAQAQYSTTPRSREKARSNLADAEYALAKQKCDAREGADKDSCMDTAKSVHTAAIADAKADRKDATSATGASTAGATAAGGGLVTMTDARDPNTSAAVDKCAQAGDAKTGCLVESKPSALRENAAAAADTAADETRATASNVAQKTENALDRAGDSTRQAAATAGDKTRDLGAKTRVAAADTAITTKVKAGLVKEPDLESLGIHVETEKGTVMLSGFVNSKTEADKAVKVAKGISGVTTVKSAIQVK